MTQPPDARAVQLTVEPMDAPLDTTLAIRVTGLPPDESVTLRTAMHDSWGRLMEAWASFVADDDGTVDVMRDAPSAGTYHTIDPMGLVWSMTPTAGAPHAPPGHGGILPPVALRLSAELEARTVAEVTIERLRMPLGVRRAEVREQGLVGTLFTPDNGEPHPAVILIGGSEGGLHEPDAALLAGHGFAVLALAYFGMRGVPQHLLSVPLEYFGTAIAWLGSQHSVRRDRIGVTGGSRGGEAALLIGATYPEVGAVVSVVGSGVLTQCIGPGSGLLEILRNRGPSWTFGGKPLPYLPNVVTAELEEQVASGGPVELGLAFPIADAAALEAAAIPVERIRGGVLILSAEDDRMWPCAALSEVAADRLRRAANPPVFRHVVYPEAGHIMVGPRYMPTTDQVLPGPGVTFQVGGQPSATAAAKADAWQQTVDFFAEHLAR